MHWSNVILPDGPAPTRAADRARRPHARAALCAIGIVMLTVLVGSAPARSDPPAPPLDPVWTWNERALATVRLKRASDAQAARLYAMLNVAMYDAVNGIVSRHGHHTGRTHALVPATEAPPQGNLYAAAAAAAHAVLVRQFQDQDEQYNQQLDSDLAALPPGRRTAAGQEWGAQVGMQVHLARANDGSTPDETQPPGSGPGQFPSAWSGVQFRHLVPFGIADSSVYVGSGPPARTSLDYAGTFAEAGRSRVVGGIHFEFSNQDGLAAGRAVATEILAHKLLRKDGPTHFGQCPIPDRQEHRGDDA